jgi:hypothetical protein
MTHPAARWAAWGLQSSEMDGRRQTGADGLSARDLAVLAHAAGMAGADTVARLRQDPALVDRLLGSPEVAQAVLGPGDATEREPLLGVSPALLFAVALQRIVDELPTVRHVNEWAGPRMRLPVLGNAELRELLAARDRRLFLVDLLASFTRVASGSVWRRTERGWRRHRYSELDLMSLAGAVDAVPEASRPQLYRRLGDLCLFLSGVFPDHTAGRLFRPIDLQRLGRAAAVDPRHDELAEALQLRGGVGLVEQLGTRWYDLAGRSAPQPSVAAHLLRAMTERFTTARRALNLLTDRYIFPLRQELFPAA